MPIYWKSYTNYSRSIQTIHKLFLNINPVRKLKNFRDSKRLKPHESPGLWDITETRGWTELCLEICRDVKCILSCIFGIQEELSGSSGKTSMKDEVCEVVTKGVCSFLPFLSYVNLFRLCVCVIPVLTRRVCVCVCCVCRTLEREHTTQKKAGVWTRTYYHTACGSNCPM